MLAARERERERERERDPTTAAKCTTTWHQMGAEDSVRDHSSQNVSFVHRVDRLLDSTDTLVAVRHVLGQWQIPRHVLLDEDRHICT